MPQRGIIKVSKYGIIFVRGTIRFVLLTTIIGLFFACTSDNDAITPEIAREPIEEPPEESLEAESFLDVSYGEASDQAYDIYLPANRSTATKVLILIHGGGWSSGDKSDMNGFKDFLINQLPEIAVVNMNYRLADETNLPYPMQTNDITTVVNTLAENRDNYRIGTEIGFMGISAGGHLALLWAYSFDVEKKVSMVCSVVGPTNLLDPAYQNSDDETIQDLINQFGQETEILEEASPLQQLTAEAPPTILFYGGKDPLIPTTQGIDLDAKLSELNVQHEFTLYENEGHGWIGLNLLDTSVKLKSFIETHLLN